MESALNVLVVNKEQKFAEIVKNALDNKYSVFHAYDTGPALNLSDKIPLHIVFFNSVFTDKDINSTIGLIRKAHPCCELVIVADNHEKSYTARALGVHRNTLLLKIKQWDISVKKQRPMNE